MKIKSLDLLKTILKTSYDTTGIIDEDTGKLNKKSIRIWILIAFAVIFTYLSYILVNTLKKIGIDSLYIDGFFMILEILVMFQASLLTLNIMYFHDDIKNYIYMPISSAKLMITKFGVVLSLIFGTEALIAVPSIFIYGIRTVKSFLFYPIALIVIFLVTIFLTSIIAIITSMLLKVFKFIKSKNIYQSIILVILTILIVAPLVTSIMSTNRNILNNDIENDIETSLSEEERIEYNKEKLIKVSDEVFKLNKILLVPSMGIKALSNVGLKSILYILEITTIDIILLSILLLTGKRNYLNSVLYIISMFNKKKAKAINFENECRINKKEIAYLKNEFKTLIKNQVYFMQYVYNILIILVILINFAVIFIPVFRQVITENIDEIIEFDFEAMSIIIGIIQLLFTISASSLTAFSRYGKNIKFFKYIPIDLRKQFILKNIPGIIINIVVILAVLITIKVLIPEIEFIYFIWMFVISMLLNIINNYILIFIDLWRPQVHLESEISIVKQNENKTLKYILTTVMCFIIWYLKEVTEKLTLKTSIIIEIIVFLVILFLLNIIVLKKNDKLFKRII